MNYHWSFVEFVINSVLFLALLVIVVAAFAFFVGIRDKLEGNRLMRELDQERNKQNEELLSQDSDDPDLSNRWRRPAG